MTPTHDSAPCMLPSPPWMYIATGYNGRAAVTGVATEFVIIGEFWYPTFKAWEREVLANEVVNVPEGARAAAHA